MNDRESGADVCFVKKVSLMFARCVAQANVRRQWSGVALFVGCDDVDPSRHPTLIVLWQLAACRCVDNDCVRQVFGVNVVDELFDVGIRRTFI